MIHQFKLETTKFSTGNKIGPSLRRPNGSLEISIASNSVQKFTDKICWFWLMGSSVRQPDDFCVCDELADEVHYNRRIQCYNYVLNIFSRIFIYVYSIHSSQHYYTHFDSCSQRSTAAFTVDTPYTVHNTRRPESVSLFCECVRRHCVRFVYFRAMYLKLTITIMIVQQYETVDISLLPQHSRDRA